VRNPWGWLTVARFGMILLVVGLISGFWGFRDQYPGPFEFGRVVSEFYGSISIELISIAFTVLILDQMYRRREAQRDKEQAIRMLTSRDAHTVAQTLARLRSDGSLDDGSLVRSDLTGALFTQAQLSGAVLSRANLRKADLSGVDLEEAQLDGADLGGSNLTNANLTGSNLESADLSGAILKSANLQDATGASSTELARAHSLCGATMSDGRQYDGRFHLAGDLEQARRRGYVEGDKTSMARFYDVPLKEYSETVPHPA
jgi:hypothetical protein